MDFKDHRVQKPFIDFTLYSDFAFADFTYWNRTVFNFRQIEKSIFQLESILKKFVIAEGISKSEIRGGMSMRRFFILNFLQLFHNFGYLKE